MKRRDKKSKRHQKEQLGFDAFSWEDVGLTREKDKGRTLRASEWWKRQRAKGICHYCKQSFPASELTMDHIVPLSRGGKSTKGNVVPACKECNTRKKDDLPFTSGVNNED